MPSFLIADTFTDSLARLTGDEQKSVKTTAFDLQVDPTGSGMSFHKLDRARDKNFWSVRASRDIRLIVHRTPGSLLLCPSSRSCLLVGGTAPARNAPEDRPSPVRGGTRTDRGDGRSATEVRRRAATLHRHP